MCGSESGNGEGSMRPEGETSSGGGSKANEQKNKTEPPKDYIHVRARRGQATDRHSLAERVNSSAKSHCLLNQIKLFVLQSSIGLLTG